MRPIGLVLMFTATLLAHRAATAGEITLYAGMDSTGEQLTIKKETPDLSTLGFNDRAMSMVVRQGRWVACVDPAFGGECQMFDVQQKGTLITMAGRISSVHEITEQNDCPGGGTSSDLTGYGQDVTLYAQAGGRGCAIALFDDVANFVRIGFNDKTTSMAIHRGSWEFCSHRNFREPCKVYGPGEHDNLETRGGFSSARKIAGEGIALYSGPGFGGDRLFVEAQTPTLEKTKLNDRAAAVAVFVGQWEFCQEPNYRGKCVSYGPGRYDQLGPMLNSISSVRRVQ